MALRDDLALWIPKFIKQTLARNGGDIITAARWNELWNLAIEQGDHNAQTHMDLLTLLYSTLLSATDATAHINVDVAGIVATSLDAALIELLSQIKSNDTDIATNVADIGSLFDMHDNQQVLIVALQDLVAANEQDIEAKLLALKGTGYTNETVKGNADAISALDVRLTQAEADHASDAAALTTHKSSADHDGRYYIKSTVDTMLNAMRGTGWTNQTLKGLQDQVDALNNTYSTDAERIAAINQLIADFESADDSIYALIDNKHADLAGVGRTTETIKANADALATHQTSADHDNRYYIRGDIDTMLAAKADASALSSYLLKTSLATPLTDGVMSKADKSKLDMLTEAAEYDYATAMSALTTHKSSADHDGRYYTESEVDTLLTPLTSHKDNSTIHVTTTDKNNWNGAVSDLANVVSGATTVPNADKLDNMHAVDFPQIEYSVCVPGTVGWYKIADTNGGDHGMAIISLFGYTSGKHCAAKFLVTSAHGRSNITQIMGNAYSSSEFTKVRTCYNADNRTYNGHAFEVYFPTAGNGAYFTIESIKHPNSYGEWRADVAPTAAPWTEDKVLDFVTTVGIQSTTDIYASGSKVWTEASLTPATILSKLLTVDGTNSALDADKLRGVTPAQTAAALSIAQRDASGNLTVNDRVNFGDNDGFVYDDTNNIMYVELDGTSHKLFHAGNDGSGSGLDADTVRTYAPATTATANTLVARDANGYVRATILNQTYSNYNTNVGTIMTQTSTTDGYLRPSTPEVVRGAMNVARVTVGTTRPTTNLRAGDIFINTAL